MSNDLIVRRPRMYIPFPPDAPMATLSPGLNKFASVIVWWTSVSKTKKKHTLHICWPVFGLLRMALDCWHKAQDAGAMEVRVRFRVGPRLDMEVACLGGEKHFALNHQGCPERFESAERNIKSRHNKAFQRVRIQSENITAPMTLASHPG